MRKEERFCRNCGLGAQPCRIALGAEPDIAMVHGVDLTKLLEPPLRSERNPLGQKARGPDGVTKAESSQEECGNTLFSRELGAREGF